MCLRLVRSSVSWFTLHNNHGTAVVESAGRKRPAKLNVLWTVTFASFAFCIFNTSGGFMDAGYLIFRQMSDKVQELEQVRDRRIRISNISCLKVAWCSCNHIQKKLLPCISNQLLKWAPVSSFHHISVTICHGKRDSAGLLCLADAWTIWVYFYRVQSLLLLQSPAALKCR